ncbi:MAG: hypothetical protein P4L51_01915 [Puia sp.]|nr:hypothetical protein [Puia sp.]
MEEKAKIRENRHSPQWLALKEKAKDDPELARMLDAAEHVMDKYSDTLRQLADS